MMSTTTTIRFVRSLAPCLASPRGPSASFQGTRFLHTTTLRRNSALTNILGDGPAPAVQVKSAGETGIELADGLILPGACIFLAGRVFLWDVPTPNDRWSNWKLEHFEIFDVIVPKPELLLLGTGKSAMLLPPKFREYLSKAGVQIDTMDTRNACSTYNLLAEEGRRVAAALLPIHPRSWERK
ncbi:unnamed protein product [Rhizoctonia solani]|uniref:NADH dehydrogenase [ubiquinone] 1 alpha subcomplex assembly factor 3 n=2 Tax=Rhizoctonia solani TaxID=456999 RepID=A0A8H7H9Q7_9AGAM|nr:hypothetical protein RHS04_03164 [Rhizoctonia solani]CAE6427772.1 unnamed protein product [Rhizoctonia solani]